MGDMTSQSVLGSPIRDGVRMMLLASAAFLSVGAGSEHMPANASHCREVTGIVEEKW